jgi:serine/threonine-protein kinase RsbW
MPMSSNEFGSNSSAERTRVLIIQRDASLRAALVEAFLARGLAVTPVDSVAEAARWIDSDSADFVVTDLESATSGHAELMNAVRKRRQVVPVILTTAEREEQIATTLRDGTIEVLRVPFRKRDIDRVIERALAVRLRHTDALKIVPFTRERIEFVIPSRVEYLDGVLNYLTERLIKMGVVHPHSTSVVLALDEAIVNAIKHGNNYDETKNVTIVADITCQEAKFSIADEGPGYSISDVPDPRAPENLLRTSGRGLLLIRTIMDEMSLNEQGNTVTMIKRAEPTPASGPGECAS